MASRSPWAAKYSNVPMRRWLAATRANTAPGSVVSRKTGSPVVTTASERVETIVKERFPSARVARLDRDAAQGGGLERILDGLRNREIDLVVGTHRLLCGDAAKADDYPYSHLGNLGYQCRQLRTDR